MQKQGRRVLALALVLFFSLGWGAPPAQADYNGAAHTVSNMWDTAFRVTSPLYALIRGYLEDKENPTEADVKQAYNQYTQNIQNNYNTTIIDASGNGLIPLTGWYSGNDVFGYNSGCSDLVFDMIYPSFRGIRNDRFGVNMIISCLNFRVPVLAEYKLIIPSVSVSCPVEMVSYDLQTPIAMSGTVVTRQYRWNRTLTITDNFVLRPDTDYLFMFSYSGLSVSNNTIFTVTASDMLYLCMVKRFDSVPDINIDTRLGPFVGNFGYFDVDGNLTLAPEISIVNEGDKTFYNPVTQETVTINDWTYDYSDRSYNLTTVDNRKVSVTYGDETIVIKEGDTTYNVYYITETPVEPTPTPSPSPTPTVQPTPGPSGEPMPSPSPGPENPDESGGILGFLKDIWNAILGIPKAILDGLTAILKALFIPSEDVTKKLQDQVDKKLPVIGDLQGVGDELVSNFSRASDPFSDARMTTRIDLGKAAGGKYGIAQIDLFDLSWYVPYRPLVDDIIVGFTWLVFLWNLYGAMPSIIHGGASGLYTTSQIQHISEEQHKKGGRK